MKVLSNIPQWMEKYIPIITDNGLKTKDKLLSSLDLLVYIDEKICDIAVLQLNIKIDLLQKLHDKNII